MKLSFSATRFEIVKLIKARLLLRITNVAKTPFAYPQIRKIIIFRYDRIGDLIVSLPLIYALKELFPQAQIIVIASKINAPIANQSDAIDKTIVKKTNLIQWVLQLLKIRMEKPDLVVDLNHSVAPHTILAARVLNAPHVASPYKEGRWNVRGSALKLFDIMPAPHPLKYGRPISETYLDIARTLGAESNKSYPYKLPKFEKSSHLPENFIVLNPCGSRNSMHLRDADLLAIADKVAVIRPGLQIVVTAIQKNYDRLAALFTSRDNVAISTPSQTILPVLVMVQHADLVITPDTALVHIACAYSTKLVAVYTSDQELFEQWRPLNKSETHIIRSKEPKGLKGYCSRKLLVSIEELLKAN